MSDEKRVVLVTGGGRGLGAAVARAFAGAGYRAAVNYSRSKERAETLAAEIGGIALCADVSETEDVQNMIEAVLARWGRLDVLINNAGIDLPSTVIKMDEETWDRVIEVNLTGAFKVLRAAVPALEESRGSVVNIISMLGLRGGYGTANYSASKSALIGLTRAAACELAPRVRVNAAAPGYMLTDMGQSVPEGVLERVKNENLLNAYSAPESAARMIVQIAEYPHISGQIFNLDSRLTGWA